MRLPRLALVASAGVLLFVSGCNAGPITVRFDAGVRPEERAIVEAVIPDWNAVTTDDAQILVTNDGDWLLTFADHIIAKGAEVYGRTCNTDGADCMRGNWVRVRRGMSEGDAKRVVRHEFGHVLGMHHLRTGQIGVMTPHDHANAISDDDIALCQAANVCGMIQERPTTSE